MYLRRVTIAVAVATVLATAAGCTSSPSAAAKPSRSATATYSAADAKFLSSLRAFPFPQLQPAAISDAKLLADGHEVCSALASHTPPATVLATLERAGASLDLGQTVVLGTVVLCPEYSDTVTAWASTLETPSAAG